MGQRLLGLADAARKTGYPVIEVPGWKTRGNDLLADDVRIIVNHHTAGPEPERTASNYPSLGVVRDGRAGLRGLLSQLGLGFDGTIYVIGSGVAWHAGDGIWKGWTNANYRGIGIEAEDGGDGDWTKPQLDCYPRLNAALCRYLGVSASWVCGHKEYARPLGRKIDPAGIQMDQMRRTVAWYLANPSRIRKTAGDDDMAVGDEILKLLKFTVQDFIRKDDSGKVIFRKTFRQAVLYAYDNAYAGRSEQRQQYAALKAAIAANSTALKALAERHEDIAGLPELVSELDAAVDKLNELPLATALVREEEEAGEPQ